VQNRRNAVPDTGVVDDPTRLAAVHATGLLDTPPEASFDRLTRLAARLTGAPVSFISLVDGQRDFYKSNYGFPEPLASKRQLEGTTLSLLDRDAGPTRHSGYARRSVFSPGAHR
jgi:hypothetical protein